MLKLSIYNSPTHTDLTLFDLSPEAEEATELFHAFKLSKEIIPDAVYELITQHMQPTDRIVSYYFDQDDNMQHMDRKTVLEYHSQSLQLN